MYKRDQQAELTLIQTDLGLVRTCLQKVNFDEWDIGINESLLEDEMEGIPNRSEYVSDKLLKVTLIYILPQTTNVMYDVQHLHNFVMKTFLSPSPLVIRIVNKYLQRITKTNVMRTLLSGVNLYNIVTNTFLLQFRSN